MQFSACLEWLFADETPDFADRIRRARAAGLDTIEFWKWSNKDVDAIAAALEETGLKVAGFVAEPMIALTDPANRGPFLEGLHRSVTVAERLGAKVLIAQAGNDLDGVSRERQRIALVETLWAAGALLERSDIRLGLEPLNTLVDHKGYFLDSTSEALDIVDTVDRAEIGIVYDVYHSAVMGEDTATVLASRVNRVFHVHIADHPGRQDPGTGGIDLKARLAWLAGHGYKGPVGLEYRPIGPSSQTVPEVVRRLR